MEELGAAIRAWRDRLDPADVGLPRHSPRRVPGLRRSELATLAGISVDYVVQLEQNRSATPSAQVCSALARALQLSADEQAHLLRLAGHTPDPGRIPRLIPPSLHRIMERLEGHPLALYDAVWRLLHWNPLLAAVFGDPARDLLVRQFGAGLSRVRHTPAERDAFERSLVADLRATSGRYPHDPEVKALITRLHDSPRFRDMWALQAVADHQSSAKTVDHPEAGEIQLDCDILTTQGSDLRLVVYTPRPGTDARSKLDLLSAIGTQRMTVS